MNYLQQKESRKNKKMILWQEMIKPKEIKIK
jgi:hypothetical protein